MRSAPFGVLALLLSGAASAHPAAVSPCEDPPSTRTEAHREAARGERAQDPGALRSASRDTAKTPAERASALRALVRHAKPAELASNLALLLSIDERQPAELRVAAAEGLLRLGAPEEAKIRIEALQDQGHPLANIFRTGYDKGVFSYAPEAKAFFERGMKSTAPRTRIDSAAAWLALGKTDTKLDPAPAWKVLAEAAGPKAKFDDRVTALAHARDHLPDPTAQKMLTTAAADADDRIAKTAKAWLEGAAK